MFIFLAAGGLGACASPPSLLPLLRVANRAIAQESQLLNADGDRAAAWLDDQRATLAAAFEADLREQANLDPQWVLTATQAYTAAREALARHEAALDRERSTRRDNLRAASEAIRRAIDLTELQDQLFADIPDLRRMSPVPGSK